MSDARPSISPRLYAAVIESTPDRVRRRLDRTPEAAAGWDWNAAEDSWTVVAGSETVTLPRAHLHSIDQLSCTCLLSPRCFHVLACLATLDIEAAGGEKNASVESDEDVQVPSAAPGADDHGAHPSERQIRAAGALATSIAQLLRVGVANAGVVVQSQLLRAVHQCRAEGLHRAAATGLRIVAGTSQFRARSAESDPAQLAEDLADVLETTRHLLGREIVPSSWIGTARRGQEPVRPRKLHGLLAEPIVARSGYAGAAAYFLGEDDRIYSASDVRPGDAQHARDAYLGGIEIGRMIQPAKQLARGRYLGTDLTASRDGRLGRGKGIKLVEQGQSSWEVESILGRFQRPVLEQWNAVFAKALLPADARPAGWDFVFLSGAVIGAFGAELLFQLASEDRPIRLAVENESAAFCFRENLRMLSHAPGLALRVIARLNPREPTVVNPLAVAGIEHDAPADDEPRMELPESLDGRIFLGFDEIRRRYLVHAQDSAVVLGERKVEPVDDPLASLRRRWIAMMLRGAGSMRRSSRHTAAAEMGMLERSGFSTAASLLDALSRSADGTGGTDTFLAVALYLRSCRHELAKSRAALAISRDGC